VHGLDVTVTAETARKLASGGAAVWKKLVSGTLLHIHTLDLHLVPMKDWWEGETEDTDDFPGPMKRTSTGERKRLKTLWVRAFGGLGWLPSWASTTLRRLYLPRMLDRGEFTWLRVASSSSLCNLQHLSMLHPVHQNKFVTGQETDDLADSAWRVLRYLRKMRSLEIDMGNCHVIDVLADVARLPALESVTLLNFAFGVDNTDLEDLLSFARQRPDHFSSLKTLFLSDDVAVCSRHWRTVEQWWRKQMRTCVAELRLSTVRLPVVVRVH
jgi:hypothetical protein